jgi:hypothetical protein
MTKKQEQENGERIAKQVVFSANNPLTRCSAGIGGSFGASGF